LADRYNQITVAVTVADGAVGEHLRAGGAARRDPSFATPSVTTVAQPVGRVPLDVAAAGVSTVRRPPLATLRDLWRYALAHGRT
jgi:hypothetical protein